MKDIIELLKTFSVDEWKQFRDFVKSPIYNKKKKIIELWEVLNKAYPNLDNTLSEEKLQKRLKITDRYLGQLFRDLKKLIDQFLVFSAIQANKPQQQLFLLQQYQTKKIDPKTIKKVLEKQRTTFALPSTQKGEKSFLYSYLFESIEYKWFTNQSKRDGNINILKCSNQLDTYYIYEKLKCLVNRFLLHDILNISINKDEVPHILALASQASFQKIPEIQLLTQFFRILHLKEESIFERYLLNLATHTKKISKYLLKGLYHQTNNFCYSQIKENKAVYLQFSFEISKRIEEEGLLDLKNKAKFMHIYFNYVVIASKVEAFEWATYFTKKYETFLPKNHQGLYHLNLAIIAFYQKDYLKAINTSYRPNIDAFYDINYQVLIIKSNYYLEEKLEDLEQIIDTFDRYITYKKDKSQSNKIALKDLEKYRNFAKLLKRLRGVKINQKKPSFKPDHGLIILKNIEKDLAATSNVVYRQWILEQIQVLRDRFTCCNQPTSSVSAL